MIRINLLPLQKRRSYWAIGRICILIGSLFAIVCTSIYSYNLMELWKIEQQLQRTHHQYQLLQTTEDIMKEATHQGQLINAKNKILLSLTKEHLSWYTILKNIAIMASPHIRLTDIIKSDKDRIQLQGWADNYSIVAEFIQNIEQNPLLIDPILSHVEKEATTQAVKFEIILTTRGI